MRRTNTRGAGQVQCDGGVEVRRSGLGDVDQAVRQLQSERVSIKHRKATIIYLSRVWQLERKNGRIWNSSICCYLKKLLRYLELTKANGRSQ